MLHIAGLKEFLINRLRFLVGESDVYDARVLSDFIALQSSTGHTGGRCSKTAVAAAPAL
jgi:hypothetical protein